MVLKCCGADKIFEDENCSLNITTSVKPANNDVFELIYFIVNEDFHRYGKFLVENQLRRKFKKC